MHDGLNVLLEGIDLLLNRSTVVWKKFTIGHFCVNFVCGEIFSSLGVSNE